MKNKAVKLAKKIIIGFFALVFIMGFFSKSIINLFLPKVRVAAAVAAPVERNLDIEGTVEARDSVKIRLGGNIIVEEYYVKPGDVILAGYPLFKINTRFGIKNSDPDTDSLKSELKREELGLQSLKQKSFKLEELDISAMEAGLQESEDDFAKREKLYEAGAIAAVELDGIKNRIREQRLDLEKAGLELEEKRKDNENDIINSRIRIEELERNIAAIEKKGAFYSKADKDGICYSDVNGIMLFTNLSDAILPQDTIIAEIAQLDNEKGLIFTAQANERDYDIVKTAGIIQLTSDYSNSAYKVRITDISQIVNQEMLSIRGVFEEGTDQGLKIGQKMKGKIKSMYSDKGLTIPKSAIIPDERFIEGQTGTVYILEERDGILGKENLSKAVKVKILAVGDSKAIVSGLGGFDYPRVITNLSYKISDGAKVFLWQ
ncbi:efflux RND transporter periplasmic adaptor subunit [Lutispora sp.]|uniref:efflux RND transporter periplasmic adaptor subunit n=1 Tax=Lutispora sp. TaxID=2828727 RepID=UPI002B1EDC70|nr:hypothetical protein [Lutispora sp.]MEA4960173.1 hypothetical protein [Lutispora sp.]